MRNIPILLVIVGAALLVFIVGSAWFINKPVEKTVSTIKPTGILEGQMALLYGNCHKKEPETINISNLTGCETRIIDGTLLITNLSTGYHESIEQKRVDTVEGQYRVRLPVGEYSLWILQNGEISCGFRTYKTPACGPIKITTGEVTRQSVLLNKAAFVTP